MARKLTDPGDIQTLISNGISLHPRLELIFQNELKKLVLQGKLELVDNVVWRIIELKYQQMIDEYGEKYY